MKINGSHLFHATPEQVWDGIRDPELLKACIPQCEEILCVSDTFWQGKARVKIGVFKTSFTGDIILSEANPPQSYRIHITAKGFVGSAEGDALVTLTPEESATRLTYNAEAHLGIKILDKAMSLADSVAADLAESFFTRLAAAVVAKNLSSAETPQ